MNVANLTDEELALCKNGTLHSNYPVVIKKGNLADYIGLTDGGLCLEFLQTNDVADLERHYDVDGCYNLANPEDRKNCTALSKDALIFDIADSKSLELSQARSAEVFKALVGRQIEEMNRAAFKLKKREKLFEDFGVPISERPRDSLLKSEWLASKKFLETGEIAKEFHPRRVNLSYYVQEDPALKAELIDLLVDKVLKAIKPKSDSPKCFAETLERMTSMGFTGWPDNVPKNLLGDPGHTVREIINGTMTEVITGSPPLAIMAALTKVSPDNRKNPWADAFLERAVQVFGDDTEVAVSNLTNLPENADTDKLLAPIQEFLPRDCKADLAVALIADGRPEIVEKLYSDKELRKLMREDSPFEEALQDKPVPVKIAVADALAGLQAKHGGIWKFKNVANLTEEELEFCQSNTWSSYPVMIKIEGVAVDMGSTDAELCLKLFEAKDVEEIRDIPELSDKIWMAFDLLNEFVDWPFAGSNYYNLEIPDRKEAYEAKAKDSLVFDATDLKQSQINSAELFRTLVGRKLEKYNETHYDYLDP